MNLSGGIGDVLKNLTGASIVNPLDSVQTTAQTIQAQAQKTGTQLEQSAEVLTNVAEVYTIIQIGISLFGLYIAYGMLEEQREMVRIQRKRFKRSK